MKILLIHNYYRYRGGEDRYMDILTDTLRQQGHQVCHFLSDSQDIAHFTFWQKLAIPFRLIRSVAQEKKLAQLIQEQKPHLAILHNLFPLFSLSLLKVLKTAGIPILKRLENYKFLCLNGLFLRNNFQVCEVCRGGNFWPGIWNRCYQRSFWHSLGIAIAEYIHRRRGTVQVGVDYYLASSQFVRSRFVEAGFPGERIAVFPNFLDFEPVVEPVMPGAGAIYVGRLSQEKGLFTLLKAFEKLPQLPLHIVGEGPLAPALKDYARAQGMDHVFFHGFVDGPAKQELWRGALLMVFPSECYESFGYTVVESYACGVPVLAADLGGVRELVFPGETGFLYEPGNPMDLQEQIKRMLADAESLKAMRWKALARAKQLYTRETGYDSLMGLFKQLVQEQEKVK